MIRSFSRNVRATMATTAVAVLLAAGVAHSTAGRPVERPVPQPQTAAELAFPDAEYGVDPVVTGPVSASFEEQRKSFGCTEAHWPNISLHCYPKR